MVTVLLIISIFLLIYLSFYALIFIILSFYAFLSKFRNKTLSKSSKTLIDKGAISVLVPSYNEEEGLIDAIESVVRQDYPGLVEIYILLNDKKNNQLEISALAKFYKFDIASSNNVIILNKDNRRINLVLTNFQFKKDKINFALTFLNQPLIAILDADHRPTANWLSSSVNILFATSEIKNKKNIREIVAVQTRRKPLLINHLAQIWDSSQNHLGNELFNNFLTKILSPNSSVFFTGTATLFKADILKKFTLSNSITEDTYLSYDLWCAGYAISYNDEAVSYEEVSPSFIDYVMRRRRWSAGHNYTFFSHILKIIKSRLPLFDKMILFLHGQFYFIPIVIWLLLGIYGYYFFLQIGHNLQLAVVIVSFVVSGILSYFFRQKNRKLYWDFLVAFLFVLPQLAIISVFIYKFSGIENYYYILVFPYAKDFMLWHLTLIFAPLIVFLSSFYFFKDSRYLKNLWLLPTYPFVLFFDIYASLLGFLDIITGNSYWSKITRHNSYSDKMVRKDLSIDFVTKKTKETSHLLIYFFAIISIFSLFILNDLLAMNNCGEIKNFIWSPLLIKPKSSCNLKVTVEKNLGANNDLNFVFSAALKGDDGDYSIEYYIDNKFIGIKNLTGKIPLEPVKIIEKNYPLGWEKHKLEIRLKGNGKNLQTVCSRKLEFSTVLKELRGQDLFINGEKFLIKGIIPSFANGQIDISLDEGFKQFKTIGINTIRLYHKANNSMLGTASKNELLIIDQPDNSTWNEVDITSENQVSNYLKRYQKMVNEHIGEPYILLDGLGNEWELNNKKKLEELVNSTNNTILKANNSVYNYPSTYSTYFTFIDYPIDITAVNMLDTGATYWDKALKTIKNINKPFYASEFGGFVAFLEDTVPELRMKRLEDEWVILLKNNAIGANFYESHDNWAQSVVVGYNDPFKAELPDDVRGFWDHDNKPKPELKVLKKLLSDFDVVIENKFINIKDTQVNLIIKNIREYNLKKVNILIQGKKYSLEDFKPNEEKTIAITLNINKISNNALTLDFDYTSHSGLDSNSQVDLTLPLLNESPLVLNDDFLTEFVSESKLSGRLLSSNNINLLIPEDWTNFKLNGQVYSKASPTMKIPISNPYHDVSNPEFSIDGVVWRKLNKEFNPGLGLYYFRFHWPEIKATNKYLILSGVGSDRVEISSGNKTNFFSTHNYRENVISSKDLNNPSVGDLINIKVYRNQISYVDKNAVDDFIKIKNSLIENIDVKFEMPIIFAPLDIIIEKTSKNN